MQSNASLIVLLKELRDSLRDRRTLLNALLIAPLLGPLLFVALLQVVIERELRDAERPLPVAVIGAQHAPNLLDALRQGGVEVQSEVADPETALREQRLDVVLRVPEAYAENWRAGRPAELELLFDSSRREAANRAGRLERLIEAYGARTVAQRLIMRGIAPSAMQPVVIARRDQATPQSRSALLFGMLPYLIILSAMMGGMFLCIDATAGERERQSLEALLALPAPRAHILRGKIAAAACFCLASALLSLIAFGIAGRIAPTNELGIELSLDVRFYMLTLTLMLPLVLLFASVQTWVAAHARSFREAQTWLSLLQLVPLIPSILLSLWPFNPPPALYAIPIAGQQFAITRLLRGEALGVELLLLCSVSTLLVALLAYAFAARSYAKESLAISA